MKITIGIITYKRPKALLRTLNSLTQLTFSINKEVKITVVIVDNDKMASANHVIEDIKSDFPFEIIYEIEPLQGIPAARNKVISLATASEFLAFIDDDEIADPLWLDELLSVQHIFNADIVSGPVIPLFEESPPQWIHKGQFFERPRYPTGTRLPFAATNNILFCQNLFGHLDGPFDKRLMLTGGSDTLLTRSLFKEGAKIIWADEAIVKEINPPHRTCEAWLVQRAFRSGLTTVLIEKYLNTSKWDWFLRLIKSIFHILKGIILMVPFIIYYGYAGLIKGIRFIAQGSGEIYALFGGIYREYA